MPPSALYCKVSEPTQIPVDAQVPAGHSPPPEKAKEKKIAVKQEAPKTIPKTAPEKTDPVKSTKKPPKSTPGICGTYNNFLAKGVPKAPLKQALAFFQQNNGKGKLEKQRYIGLADYSQRSTKKRFYLLDLATGEVISEKVAHGGGSRNGSYAGDPDHNGYIKRCQHPNGSRTNMTRPGFFAVSEFYYSDHGSDSGWTELTDGKNGLRLDGLSAGVNDEARDQGVVMHETRKYGFGGDAIMGRSFGCPAFVPGKGAPLMKKLSGGSLLYAYVPACGKDMSKVLKQVQDWETFCE